MYALLIINNQPYREEDNILSKIKQILYSTHGNSNKDSKDLHTLLWDDHEDDLRIYPMNRTSTHV